MSDNVDKNRIKSSLFTRMNRNHGWIAFLLLATGLGVLGLTRDYLHICNPGIDTFATCCYVMSLVVLLRKAPEDK